MSNGKLIPPNLDDRKWQDIVDEAKALIPKYAPEWTDHNPSDLGITLIELFAWIVEGMIYRLNKVPERNYIEFLNLLGITRDPATPASTFLTYRISGTTVITVSKGSQVATQQTEKEEGIVFETDKELEVLPINLKNALIFRSTRFVQHYRNATTNLVGSPLSGISFPIDYFHRGSESVMLMLGFDSPTTQPIPLLFSFNKPMKNGDIDITWRYSRGTANPFSWPVIPAVNDGTNKFQKNGNSSLTIPSDWESQNPSSSWSRTSPEPIADAVDEALFWIGIQINNNKGYLLMINLEHILFNSVPATNAITTTQPELLGVSNGKSFQFFELKNRPLFKIPGAQNPYDHLEIQIREPLVGGGLWKKWNRIEDFPEGAEECYRLNPVTGTINFGNHSTTSTDGHGKIPPLGSEIQALPYRYVIGGKKGNVPPDTIRTFRTTPPAGVVSVTNLAAASGGSEEEDIEETKRRGPETLRNRYRAVTIEDYEYLAREATTDVKKVRCLPQRLITEYEDSTGYSVGHPWTYGGLNRSTGNVNVIIIQEAPLSNPQPMPSEELLQEVSDYLEERRTVTARLHVTSPRYLPIHVTVNIIVWKKAVKLGLTPDPDIFADPENNPLVVETKEQIKQFLHPILGGPEGEGWEIGQDITISSLFEYIKPSSNIGFISSLEIQETTPGYTPPDRPPFLVSHVPGVWVRLADYEIVCSDITHSVTVTKI